MQVAFSRSGIICALFSTSSTVIGRVAAISKGTAFVSHHSHRQHLLSSPSSLLSSKPAFVFSTLSSPTTSPLQFQLYAKGKEKSASGSTTKAKRKTSTTKKKATIKTKKLSTDTDPTTKSTTKKKKATTTKKMPATKKGTKKSAAKRSTKKKDEPPAIPHADESLITSSFEQTRSKLLTLNTPLPREKGNLDNPCITYWMMRDVRTIDNWALIFAQSLAIQKEVPLRVVYTLQPPPDAEAEESEDGAPPPNPADMSLTERHGTFLLDGLSVVAEELTEVNVPFDALCPASRSAVGQSIHDYCTNNAHNSLAVVCDMSPLRHPRQWTETQATPLLEGQSIPLYQVDAHNIVPVWIASPKREVGARTLRPKIHNVFSDYCTTFPEFKGNAHLDEEEVPSMKGSHDWDQYKEYMQLDTSIKPVSGMTAGHEGAMKRFTDFCTSKEYGLKNFDKLRNDPNYKSVCTNLSPWINHGQVSFQRLALDVRAFKKHPNGTAAYIEEGVVRRELSDNFVYYNPDGYDSLSGAAQWAQDSLELHRSDEQEHLYTWKELEQGMTHDDLWNAAQLQLVREGGMHGFMRMYWCKKILEWTPSPSYALATAQYFNDRYAYDGNDPNGFVGVGWSIMGIHDMGW